MHPYELPFIHSSSCFAISTSLKFMVVLREQTALFGFTATNRVGILLKLNEKSINPPPLYPHILPVDHFDSILLLQTAHPPPAFFLHFFFTFCKLPMKNTVSQLHALAKQGTYCLRNRGEKKVIFPRVWLLFTNLCY